MDRELAIAQALRYAEELRFLNTQERKERGRAESALARLEESYGATVRALATALELRDDLTGGHAVRVARTACELTMLVDASLLADPQYEYGYLLHDVGKIGIADGILLKPAPLTESEWEEMRRHPALGVAIVSHVPHLNGVARDIVAAHHERWDGTGYPAGLRGEAIPLAARIFAIADTFDAMTNDRPYRTAPGVDCALEEIEAGAGRQFDPLLTKVFTGSRWSRTAA